MIVRSVLVISALTFFSSGALAAPIPASGPDDICDPLDDPCVIDEVYEVLPPGQLDFGTRDVHMLPGGRLLGSVHLDCGDLLISVGANTVAIDSSQSGGVAGTITLMASGSVTIDGKLQARGNPGGEIWIEGYDAVVVSGRLLADGSPIGSDGGDIFVRGDSVVTNETIVTRSIKGNYADGGPLGGAVFLSGETVNMNGAVETGGGTSGGLMDISTSGLLTISNDITTTAGNNLAGRGGYMYVYSYGGIDITGSGPTQTNDSRLTGNGTTYTYVSPYGYKYPYAGYGGLGFFRAFEGDINISKHVNMTFNGGPIPSSYGGLLLVYSYEDIVMDGNVTMKGYGRYGRGGYAYFDGDYSVRTGESSTIELRSKYGGSARLAAYGDFDVPGYLRLDGTVDVQGNNKVGNGEYSNYGEAGTLKVYGDDVVIGGRMLTGADGGSGSLDFSFCRLHLLDGARLDASHGAPLGGGDVAIEVEESFIAEPGSRILADPQGGGGVSIRHRAAKPPLLNGTIVPDPTVTAALSSGCPVCGNLEIDAGESCDDGNLVNGDGCNDECQDEGCIAETPGYPGTPLCSDGDDCTVDSCDPVLSTCQHVASCEEGIACTVDACVFGTCEHTPDDLLCDDFNACTDDVCNEVTGCSHATLTGVPCEDGDLCTVTGDCDSGDCVATDGVYAVNNSMKFRFKDGPDNDKASYKAELPLSEYTANPALTGMTVELRDSDSRILLSGVIPAGSFEDKDGTGDSVRFRDKDHLLPSGAGIEQIAIRRSVSKGVAKVKLKIGDTEIPGADGQFRMTLSMLFGTSPALDDCLTGRHIPCTPKTGKNRCKDPK